MTRRNSCGIDNCTCKLRGAWQVNEFLRKIEETYPLIETIGELDDVLFQLMSRRPDELPEGLDLTQVEIQELIVHLGFEHFPEIAAARSAAFQRLQPEPKTKLVLAGIIIAAIAMMACFVLAALAARH